MKLGSLILIGAGGHARACIDVVEQEGRFTIVGLIGTPDEVGERVLGYPVVGADEDLAALVSVHRQALIAVGQIKTPGVRMRLFSAVQALGASLPTVVSPRSYVSKHASVGAGTVVLHGAVINAGAVVGRNCIINSQSLVEHDAVIGDHCHVSTGSAINSGVHLGEGTFVGSNSSVRQGILIGSRCVIGMGQRILADCPDGTQIPPGNIHGPSDQLSRS